MKTNWPAPSLSKPALAIALSVGLTLPCVSRVGAQTPAPAKAEPTLEEMRRHPPTGAPSDKIAPTMENPKAYAAHSEMLGRLYPAELMRPLTDHFDRTVPGGFKAALAHARDAGIPDALLAEVESMRATFDVNYPALVATMPRLRASWQHWDEKASLFPSHNEFEAYLKIVFDTVERERTNPGSFAQTALRLRKRDIARVVYNELRMVDGDTDEYIIEHNLRVGTVVPVEAWLSKMDPNSHLVIDKGADVTGQPFGPQRAGEMPAVPPATYRAVADAVPDDFWKPYRIPTAPATAQR